VSARLLPLLVLGNLATCAAIRHELSVLEPATATPAMSALSRVELRWLPTDDADLRKASEVQAELTRQGEPRLLWSRLVIAAVAARYDTTLLHYAGDYDLIAKVTEQVVEWICPPGTLPELPRRPSPDP
jgi:predicted nucleic acid-binding protein